MDAYPQRIGDAERDAAIERLRAAHGEGRLTLDEFDERMDAALAAKTQSDLDPLFYDLPTTAQLAVPASASTSPAAATAADVPAPASQNLSNRLVAAFSALAWPIALVICFATSWSYWWIMLIPIFITPALWALVGQSGPSSPPRSRRPQR